MQLYQYAKLEDQEFHLRNLFLGCYDQSEGTQVKGKNFRSLKLDWPNITRIKNQRSNGSNKNEPKKEAKSR